MTTAFRVAAAVALLWAGWGALVWSMQRRLLFPGTGRSAPETLAPVAGREVLWFQTPEAGEGARVEAWWLPPTVPAEAPVPAILFAHGNGELIDDWAHGFDGFRAAGYGVLLVEFPGYGRSTGEPSEGAIAQGMQAAFDALAERADPKRIIGWGRSMGGGAIGTLLGERPLSAVVFQSTFSSIRPFARGLLLPGALARDPFDTAERLKGFPGPVLVMHGEADEVIPVAHGRTLARAAGVELTLLPGGHNSGWEGAAREAARRFFRQALGDRRRGNEPGQSTQEEP